MPQSVSAATRLWRLVQEERSDITAIYFFAIMNGLIQLSVPVGIQAIIGFVLGGTLSASLSVLISILIAGVLFAGIMQVNQMRIIERIQQRIFVKYSFQFADRIPKLDLKKADKDYLPELVNRFFETTSLQKGFAKLLLELPVAMIQILFGLLLLSFYHPFFIFFGVLLLLLLWLILGTTGGKGLESSLAESRFKYGVVGWFEEMARLVKSFKFAGWGLHIKKADERTIKYLQARTKHFKVLEFQYSVMIAFKVGITAAMVIGGVVLLLNQQINIGQFVAAEIIIITIISSIEKMITNLDSVYDVLTAVEKIEKLTDKPIDSDGSLPLQKPGPLSITANNLSFGYDPDNNVLTDLDFEVGPGEKVCITGMAGSGKSTLLRLLTGVYNHMSGELLINKIPIGNYDLQSLRQKMGIFFHQENVFQGTLWENLTMGRSDVSHEHVMELCEKTGLQTFVARLPQGFDTELDPTGKRLPGNVVRKILLVRALSHQPALLIMEEPWEGFDEENGKRIQQLLLQTKDTTVIVSTEDESFARECDRVIQLKK
jgi:ATP-binding cassette, subfamily B, bacterial